MSVFYKFASSTEVNTVVFDGVHISVADLKLAIMDQKKLGRGTDFDLVVTNAQTAEEYKKNDTLIAKNTSLVVKRVPAANGAPVKKFWDPNAPKTSNITASFAASVLPPQMAGMDLPPASGAVSFAGSDLTKITGTEEDKIKHMMSQSTSQYDPSRYVKFKGQHLLTPAPNTHKCYRCFNFGHYVQNCPLVAADVKKATGIPRSFMVRVADPKTPGAMIAPDGTLAVHRVDYTTYQDKQQGRNDSPPPCTRPTVPDDLRCTLCRDLMRDAVTSPCCGENFCDECLRTALVESAQNECPNCHQPDVSPDNIIPNRFIRKRVTKFEKETDYWELVAREKEANDQKTAPPPVSSTPPAVPPSVVDAARSAAVAPVPADAPLQPLSAPPPELSSSPPHNQYTDNLPPPMMLHQQGVTAAVAAHHQEQLFPAKSSPALPQQPLSPSPPHSAPEQRRGSLPLSQQLERSPPRRRGRSSLSPPPPPRGASPQTHQHRRGPARRATPPPPAAASAQLLHQSPRSGNSVGLGRVAACRG